MATKARKSTGRKSTRSGRKGATRKASARKAGARKASARKAGARAARRGTSTSAKKSASKSTPAKRSRLAGVAKRLPVARVKRVTREVVQQATEAVSAGVDTLKDFGENLVNRVRA